MASLVGLENLHCSFDTAMLVMRGHEFEADPRILFTHFSDTYAGGHVVRHYKDGRAITSVSGSSVECLGSVHFPSAFNSFFLQGDDFTTLRRNPDRAMHKLALRDGRGLALLSDMSPGDNADDQDHMFYLQMTSAGKAITVQFGADGEVVAAVCLRYRLTNLDVDDYGVGNRVCFSRPRSPGSNQQWALNEHDGTISPRGSRHLVLGWCSLAPHAAQLVKRGDPAQLQFLCKPDDKVVFLGEQLEPLQQWEREIQKKLQSAGSDSVKFVDPWLGQEWMIHQHESFVSSIVANIKPDKPPDEECATDQIGDGNVRPFPCCARDSVEKILYRRHRATRLADQLEKELVRRLSLDAGTLKQTAPETLRAEMHADSAAFDCSLDSSREREYLCSYASNIAEKSERQVPTSRTAQPSSRIPQMWSCGVSIINDKIFRFDGGRIKPGDRVCSTHVFRASAERRRSEQAVLDVLTPRAGRYYSYSNGSFNGHEFKFQSSSDGGRSFRIEYLAGASSYPPIWHGVRIAPNRLRLKPPGHSAVTCALISDTEIALTQTDWLAAGITWKHESVS